MYWWKMRTCDWIHYAIVKVPIWIQKPPFSLEEGTKSARGRGEYNPPFPELIRRFVFYFTSCELNEYHFNYVQTENKYCWTLIFQCSVICIFGCHFWIFYFFYWLNNRLQCRVELKYLVLNESINSSNVILYPDCESVDWNRVEILFCFE